MAVAEPMRAPAAASVDAALLGERARIDAAVAAAAEAVAAGAPDALREPMRYALATPGKRIRPVLSVAAWRALRG